MKTSFLNRLIHAIRSEMGSPVRVAHVLHEHQPRPVNLEDPLLPSINLAEVKAWDQLCPRHHMGPGFVDGWAYSNAKQRFERFTTRVPGYAQLAQKHVVERWPCDIRHVHGLTHSSSDLSTFQTLSEMATKTAPEYIANVSIEKLSENLAHEHIGDSDPWRISDQFVVRLWNPAIYLTNQGGSHHFAAAQHIATQLDQKVLLHRTAVFHLINPEALRQTLNDYTLYALPQDDAFLNDLHEAMSSFRASYLMHQMPATFGEASAILLPRSDARSMAVANTLRRCGTASLDEQLTRIAQNGESTAMRMGLSMSDPAAEGRHPPPTPAAYARERQAM